MTDYKGIEGHSDLVKDMHQSCTNTNRSIPYKPKRKKTFIAQRDGLRDEQER